MNFKSVMGRKIDALLGRTLKTYKFKPVVSLAISRLSVLTKQRQARMSVARSDVIELLKLGHHERALNRVILQLHNHSCYNFYPCVMHLALVYNGMSNIDRLSK